MAGVVMLPRGLRRTPRRIRQRVDQLRWKHLLAERNQLERSDQWLARYGLLRIAVHTGVDGLDNACDIMVIGHDTDTRGWQFLPKLPTRVELGSPRPSIPY